MTTQDYGQYTALWWDVFGEYPDCHLADGELPYLNYIAAIEDALVELVGYESKRLHNRTDIYSGTLLVASVRHYYGLGLPMMTKSEMANLIGCRIGTISYILGKAIRMLRHPRRRSRMRALASISQTNSQTHRPVLHPTLQGAWSEHVARKGEVSQSLDYSKRVKWIRAFNAKMRARAKERGLAYP